ncbi:universal stress protein, partial [Staphylococcus simulans]
VYDAQFTEKSKNFSEDLLNGYKEVATNAGVANVETRLEFGSPKAIIPKKLAADVDADLIMCGTSGLNAVERFIVGSVSEAIVRHSPCDVLVVRTEEIPEDFQPQVATDEFRSQYQAR